MPPEDETLPAEELPLPAAVSPTADSSGYVPELDLDEDPEEDDDEDPKEDPADYPADGGDDGDDEDDSSDDDEDEDETEPFETNESAATPPPHPAYHVTARISIRDETPISLPPREEVERLLVMPTPPSLYFPYESSSAAAARPTRGLRADYGFVATIDREIIRDLERDVGYGITDTWDEMLVDMLGVPATDDTELG
ncbi:hypothetical protein Tco_1084999 [Tanacetum coccineum]